MPGGPTVRRRRLAGELKRLRDQAGLTVESAADAAEISRSQLSRIENAAVRVQGPVVRALLRAYGQAGTDLERYLVDLARQASTPGWWQQFEFLEDTATFIAFESDAAAVQTYEAVVLPGIMQTEEYARAIQAPFRSADEDVDRRVQVRMQRQRRLADLSIWAVIEETVLTRPTGGPAAMKRQLERLVELSRQRNITIQILPHELGAHTGIDGPFTVFQFADERDPDIAYSEGQLGQLWVDDRERVRAVHEHFDHLRAAALDADASREQINSTAARYTSKRRTADEK